MKQEISLEFGYKLQQQFCSKAKDINGKQNNLKIRIFIYKVT
jgi:hypothetical protein